MMGNTLIGQSLANKKQKDRPGNVYMQISYACVVLMFHSQHVRNVHNGIRKDSQAFLSISNNRKTDLQGS